MPDDSLLLSPAVELLRALRRRDIASRELLDGYLHRIERSNRSLNAVVTLDPEGALAAARAADEATARGNEVGPLHGLPITVKDAIETEALRSTGGATELADHVPTVDAPAVARLRAAGAIVFGKTNCPRWSADVQTYNELFGTTNNPWDTSRTPGGSSGGAAAAVAAGLTAFELGTDIGGSVRIPSHFCGIYGLKPSYGAVPQRGYLDCVGGGVTDADVNVFGPLARSAADLDLLLAVLAGPAPEDEPAWRLELPHPASPDLAGRRLAVWFEQPGHPLHPDVAAALASAAGAAEEAGAELVEDHPPVDFDAQVALFHGLVGAATSVSMPEELGRTFGGHHFDWLAMDRRRASLRQTWSRWWAETAIDGLLCPVAPVPAFPHNQEGTLLERVVSLDGREWPYLNLLAWTGLIGVVGLPSAVVPVGATQGELPIGMQVVAPYLRDRDAIAIAGRIGELGRGYRSPADG